MTVPWKLDRYEKIILNTLLDKYEKSKSFIGENKVNQKFAVKVAAMFPAYSDHSNFEEFQAVNEAIDVLVRQERVSAKISKANVCLEVSLNLERLDETYRYIGRTQKKAIHEAVLQLLERYRGTNDVLARYCAAQVERIHANKSIQFFQGDLQELEDILIAVGSLLQVESETFVRDFSIRVFKDSKRFERIAAKAVSLLYEYGDFPEKDQVLESLNIVSTPTYVNFKGAGAIVLSGQRIDLRGFKGDIAISSALLEEIERIEITGDVVMTVENLTSFHMAESAEMFLIYLGGFHNRIRREFIRKVHAQNPDKAFRHFGDVDAGGFYILEHLRRLTGVDFEPYRMDVETLRQYRDFSKRLSDNDRDRLKRLQGGRFDEVISYMLEHDCKLEQEAVRF
jgi:hypothetical protein